MFKFLTLISAAFSQSCDIDADCSSGSCLISKSCDSSTLGGCVPVDIGSNYKVYTYVAPDSEKGEKGTCYNVGVDGDTCNFDNNACGVDYVCGTKAGSGPPDTCVKPCTARHTKKMGGAGGWLACPTGYICANTLWCNNKTECVKDKSEAYTIGISEVGLEESIHYCEPAAVTNGACGVSSFCEPPYACINGTCQLHNIECTTNNDCLYQTDTRYCMVSYKDDAYPDHTFYRAPASGTKGKCINQPNKVTSPPQAVKNAPWDGISCDDDDNNGCENACRLSDNKCVTPCILGDKCPTGKTCLDVEFCMDDDHTDCSNTRRNDTDIAVFFAIESADRVGTCMAMAGDIDACDLYENGCADGSYCELQYTRPRCHEE